MSTFAVDRIPHDRTVAIDALKLILPILTGDLLGSVQYEGEPGWMVDEGNHTDNDNLKAVTLSVWWATGRWPGRHDPRDIPETEAAHERLRKALGRLRYKPGRKMATGVITTQIYHAEVRYLYGWSHCQLAGVHALDPVAAEDR